MLENLTKFEFADASGFEDCYIVIEIDHIERTKLVTTKANIG